MKTSKFSPLEINPLYGIDSVDPKVSEGITTDT